MASSYNSGMKKFLGAIFYLVVLLPLTWLILYGMRKAKSDEQQR